MKIKGLVRFAFVVALFPALVSLAAPRRGVLIAIHKEGKGEYLPIHQQTWKLLKVGQTVANGEAVRTEKGAIADFVVTTKSFLRLDDGAQLLVDRVEEESHGLPAPPAKGGPQVDRHTQMSLLSFEQGEIIGLVCPHFTDNSYYQIQTPVGPLSVRGAEFILWRDDNKICVRAMLDVVTFHIQDQVVTLKQGEQICVPFVPATGAVQGNLPPLTAAPTDDIRASHFLAFKQFTRNLVHLVCEPEEIEVPALLREIFAPEPPPDVPPPPPPPEVSISQP